MIFTPTKEFSEKMAPIHQVSSDFNIKARFLQHVRAGSQNIKGFLKISYFHIWSIAKFD
jgi:hypothetical protein